MNSAISNQILALNSKVALTGDTTPGYLPQALAGSPAILNLNPKRNVSLNNQLDIFTKSALAYPDAQNPIIISIPDGNGFTLRTRDSQLALSGTCSILLTDAIGYWGYASVDGELNTCYLYAIWDSLNSEVVFALAGESGLNLVDTTTDATQTSYFLLETSSTYTKVATDYCVALAAIQFEYNTSDNPDYTISSNIRLILDKDPQEVNSKINESSKISSENLTDEIWYSSGGTINETGTTSTSFKINSSGNEADLQTTGLTNDRDFTFPNIDTMIAGSVLLAQNSFDIISY